MEPIGAKLSKWTNEPMPSNRAMDENVNISDNCNYNKKVQECIKSWWLNYNSEEYFERSTFKISWEGFWISFIYLEYEKKLEFAKMHKDWPVCNKKKVVFSNETRINFLYSDGTYWC